MSYVDGWVKPNPTSAWIIGNGFDLSMGLKSSYKDFLCSGIFSGISSANQLAAELKKADENSRWIDIESEIAKIAGTPGKMVAKGDFLEVRNALREYILSLSIDTSKNSRGRDLIIDLYRPSCIVYNFNYSTCFLQTLAAVKNCNAEQSVIHPHGSVLTNDIVFGISDHTVVNSRHGFLLKGAAKRLNTTDLISTLLKCREIVVFGHSLGGMDHMYFKPLFEHLVKHLKEKRTLRFFPFREEGYEDLHEQIQVLSDRNLSLLKSHHNFEIIQIDE